VSIRITTITATPRLRRDWASMSLGGGDRMGSPAFQTQWPAQRPHVEAMPMLGAISPNHPVNPIFIRDRVVGAAVKGSPPRGAPR
jgi:hypothetical protein